MFRSTTTFLSVPATLLTTFTFFGHRLRLVPHATIASKKQEEILMQVYHLTRHLFHFTVEPPGSGHPRDQKKCLLKRGVHLREVKNVVFVCGWDHA